eukprot:1772002-Amphidinium_carterae.2
MNASSIQFGSQKQGALQILGRTERHVRRHPGHVIAQIDIANAFGSISRKDVLAILEAHLSADARSSWLPWVHQHLSAPTRVIATDEGETEETYDGIPQGDPLSSL